MWKDDQISISSQIFFFWRRGSPALPLTITLHFRTLISFIIFSIVLIISLGIYLFGSLSSSWTVNPMRAKALSCSSLHCQYFAYMAHKGHSIIIFFFGCAHGMWKFSGQQSNPCHSSKPSYYSDNISSLIHCTTRKLFNEFFLLRATGEVQSINIFANEE